MIVEQIKILGLPVSFRGPPLEAGPLPALFYFALAGEESLGKDPINQPLVAFENLPIRVFSWDIPHHSPGRDPKIALDGWREDFEKGIDPITPFIETSNRIIQELIHKNFVSPNKMAVAGLSRGAFLATHLAAFISDISILVGFAPLTKISSLTEKHLFPNLHLEMLTEKLFGKKIHLFIGNNDELVGTDNCYHFFRHLVSYSSKKTRHPLKIEMTLFPSIGYKGHGTPPDIFKEGGLWIIQQLNEAHSS